MLPTKKNNKINKNDWFYLGRWVDNVLDTDFWSHWSETKAIKRITEIKCSSDRLSLDGHFYHSREMHEKVKKESYLAAKNKDFSYFSNFCKVTSGVIKHLIKIRKEFAKKENFSPRDLKKFFNEFQELFTPWLIIFPISEGLEEYFKEELEKNNLSLKDIQPAFKPFKDPEITKQIKEVKAFSEYLGDKRRLDIIKTGNIEKIEKEIRNNEPELSKKIKKHFKKFSWIGIHHFWGQSLTKEKFYSEMRDYAEKYPFKKEESKFFFIPRGLKRYINILNKISYWRFRCAEVTGFIVHAIMPQLTEVARKLGLEYEELYWFNRNEILDAFGKNKKLSKKIADNRRKKFGYIYFKEKEEIFTGKKLKEMENVFLRSTESAKREIVGVVASKGKITKGKVRIVIEPADVKKFARNEILVSPETTPDFVPAMKLASAIITDMGGITSHAAIVSRELEIPCVIGTKVATQILKDGDLVEVDAERGVVKILKRK